MPAVSIVRPLLVAANQTSPSSATTVAATGVTGFALYDAITIVATVAGTTGGTLDVCVQHSPDGVTWYDYVHFPQALAAAASVIYAYPPVANDNIVVIGKDTTPLLAAGSAAGGVWFDRLRVLFVAGAGTSVGAVQSVNVLCSRLSARGN